MVKVTTFDNSDLNQNHTTYKMPQVNMNPVGILCTWPAAARPEAITAADSRAYIIFSPFRIFGRLILLIMNAQLFIIARRMYLHLAYAPNKSFLIAAI
jgi:hypothetical protein